MKKWVINIPQKGDYIGNVVTFGLGQGNFHME